MVAGIWTGMDAVAGLGIGRCSLALAIAAHPQPKATHDPERTITGCLRTTSNKGMA